MALELLQVTELDFVYDLGCGDGRMLVEAITKSGAQGVGIEYDRKYAERAKQRMKDAGVADKVRPDFRACTGLACKPMVVDKPSKQRQASL
ncbi:unnamed protein product [Discosporangium mesarthrocarpum]